MLSGWIKGAFHGGKKDVQESIREKLNLVLSTAPMWDRSVALHSSLFSVMTLTFS